MPTKNAHIVPQLRKHAVEISKLNHDPGNARRHDASNVAAVKEALALRTHPETGEVTGGQNQLLVVQKHSEQHGPMIIRVGNCRVVAAKELGWKTVAAVVLDITDAEATRIALEDNRLGEMGDWDEQALQDGLQFLADIEGTVSARAYTTALGWDPDDFGLSEELEAASQAVESAIDDGADAEKGQRAARRDSEMSRETFDTNQIRQIILFYGYEEHAAMVEAFAAAREAMGVDNNSAVVEQLLNEYAERQ